MSKTEIVCDGCRGRAAVCRANCPANGKERALCLTCACDGTFRSIRPLPGARVIPKWVREKMTAKFIAIVRVGILQAGGISEADSTYDLSILTKAGLLHVHPAPRVIFTRFEDPAAAAKILGVSDHINTFSGKWNFHFGGETRSGIVPLRDEAYRFLERVRALLPGPDEKGGHMSRAEYDTHYSVIADVDAVELFDSENANWRFCMKKENATFHHKEACEFILDCGTEEKFKDTVAQMQEFGCTEEFIESYREAYNAGAKRVLYYA